MDIGLLNEFYRERNLIYAITENCCKTNKIFLGIIIVIMINRNNIIDTEKFYQEMGKLIYNFDKIVETVKYDSRELLVFYILIKKIISNATSANILICENQINEAKIILRSAIETVILITYLSRFPNKINDYLDEAQILKIKNNFIVFKSLKDGEPIYIEGNTCSKKELLVENKKCFDTIQDSAKFKILNATKLKEFIITEENFNKIDKFFKNFKPEFMRYEQMYKELDNTGFRLNDVFEYSLRDIVFGFYNDSSQVTHGCFLDWNHKPKFNQKEAEYMFHFFTKVTLFLKVLLKGIVNFNTTNSMQYLLEMKQATENLEKLIYGTKLKH